MNLIKKLNKIKYSIMCHYEFTKFSYHEIKSDKKIIFKDIIIIILIYFFLKLVQYSNTHHLFILSNNKFNWFFFILFIIFITTGFFYPLKKWVKLIKDKEITSIWSIFYHFIFLIIFVISIFSIIFNNPYDDNKILDSNNLEKDTCCSWINSIYFTTSTLVGGGYGDYIPQGTQFKLFSIFLMIFGWIIFGVLFSSLVSYYLNKN